MEYLVLDIGGTEIKYAILDQTGEIVEKYAVRTPGEEVSDVDTFVDILGQLYDSYADRVKGIAISMPGIIDSEKGYCYTGGALPYNANQPFAGLVSNRCNDVPVSIENDGKCAALAEQWMGSLKGCMNAAVIVLGTSVGGCFIVNGKLVKGKHFTAGECGFVVLNKSAKTSNLGFWSGAGGNAYLRTLVAQETGTTAEEWDGHKIFALANEGEGRVLRALDQFVEILATQLFNIHALLDLDAIAIGGGISKQPLLLQLINQKIAAFLAENALKDYTDALCVPEVVACTFHNEANLIGALYNYKLMHEA